MRIKETTKERTFTLEVSESELRAVQKCFYYAAYIRNSNERTEHMKLHDQFKEALDDDE